MLMGSTWGEREREGRRFLEGCLFFHGFKTLEHLEECFIRAKSVTGGGKVRQGGLGEGKKP